MMKCNCHWTLFFGFPEASGQPLWDTQEVDETELWSDPPGPYCLSIYSIACYAELLHTHKMKDWDEELEATTETP